MIRGTAARWWLYTSTESRSLGEERAAREGRALPAVMRAFLDAYAAGKIDPPASEELT